MDSEADIDRFNRRKRVAEASMPTKFVPKTPPLVTDRHTGNTRINPRPAIQDNPIGSNEPITNYSLNPHPAIQDNHIPSSEPDPFPNYRLRSPVQDSHLAKDTYAPPASNVKINTDQRDALAPGVRTPGLFGKFLRHFGGGK